MTEEPDVVGNEIKRQLVILVFTVAGVGIVMAIQADSATRRRVVMRAALWVKQTANRGADMLEAVALKAATIYNRNRSVPD